MSDHSDQGSSPIEPAGRASPLLVGETLRLIAEELGQRTKEDMRYKNAGSLASLAATCKFIASHLEPILYAQDVKEKRFKGLKHAVYSCGDRLAVAILKKYPQRLLKNNVNANLGVTSRPAHRNDICFTMLHVAAARQLYDTIKKLYKLDAKWIYAKNFRSAMPESLEQQFEQKQHKSFPGLQHIIYGMLWAPNFAPMIHGDNYTCAILAGYWPDHHFFVGKFNHSTSIGDDHMTLLHLAVYLHPSPKSLESVQAVAEEYPHLNPLPVGDYRGSVHHLAVVAQNGKALEYLLHEVMDDQTYYIDNRGYNPLHLAVELCLQGDGVPGPNGQSGSTRLLNVLLSLKHRINPAMPQTMAPYKTPLLIVAKMIHLDWSGRSTLIKKLLDQLIDLEEDYAEAWGLGSTSFAINRPDSDGKTVLGHITSAILESPPSKGNKALENLFKKLVDEHGADINLDANQFPSARIRAYVPSIKWRADRAQGFTQFKRVIEELGGRLHQAELDNTMTRTLASPYPDQRHLQQLPANHPYAMPGPLNDVFVPLSPTEVAARSAAQSRLARARALIAARDSGSINEQTIANFVANLNGASHTG
ncbi:uncharacterized protein B0J16DRAFT_396843 [Fusarium flagelliforme]|uniref:Ankyrin repeat protein n=1 Tax=Fusarium flagelliforme TaxID=2675880 RepID=A0A395MFU0_9HYPO|nr:uncharacterized protein B0J16DRAFT_396843 [Fusarium flagelliforme]KAH7188766.1 hypothetical protein B0J16DRAFT_396843 [Fusarium flagelliforme]RFN46772.1 hypothetical protein FIE12Z_9018 [Fusarium flagelliforme]